VFPSFQHQQTPTPRRQWLAHQGARARQRHLAQVAKKEQQMSDNGHDPLAAAAAAPAIAAELRITMLATGQVHVTGPIENKILSYGLLEVAREVIAEHAKAQQRLVQPASMVFRPGGRS
jgi:hypothetical protein